MRKLGIVLAALACLSFVVVPVASAAGFNWGLGANLGFNMLTPDKKYAPDNKSVTTYGWPTGGLRLSFAGEKPTHEVYLESSLYYASVKDAGSTHDFIVSGNYQYNFDMKGPVAPYLTAGVGVDMAGDKFVSTSGDVTVSASSMFYGGGVGVAHHMGNGCGRLRAEVRYDMRAEGKTTVSGVEHVILEKGSEIGLKLGFDLWDKK